MIDQRQPNPNGMDWQELFWLAYDAYDALAEIWRYVSPAIAALSLLNSYPWE